MSNACAIFVCLAASLIVAMLAYCIWSLFKKRTPAMWEVVLFFCATGFCLLALNWPQISWPHEMNPDESQMVAQSMRFLEHPVPWRDVDGTTSGPLNSMLLSLPLALGAPANWETARIMQCGLNFLTLVLVYLTLRVFGTRSEAMFALLPNVFFYAFTYSNFAPYNSETLSVLILSAVIFFLAWEWQAERTSKARLFLLGILCGSVPFAKLQAVPQALFLASIAGALIFLRWRNRRGSRIIGWQEPALLVLGGLLIPGVVLGTVAAKGAFADFWKSYLLAANAYAGQSTTIQRIRAVDFIVLRPSEIRGYFFSVFAATALLYIAWRRRSSQLEKNLRWPLVVILTNGALAVLSLLISGKPFPHYALLLIPSLAVLIGLCLMAGTGMLKEKTLHSKFHLSWLQTFSVAVLACQLFKDPQYVLTFLRDKWHKPLPIMSLVAREIKQESRPGDVMSVWGWMPAYYVETGLMPATRDAIGHYFVYPGIYQEYYRRRYLADLEQNRPAIFVDAVADGTFSWPYSRPKPHEDFPELNQFINDNYHLWLKVHMTNQMFVGTPIRIYVLKERELEPMPQDIYSAFDPSYRFP